MRDLNLLRILCAVIDCGSVTAAAARLNLSQPTVSQSLARLRDITGDPLFSRDAQRMVPTAHALRLYSDCALSLERLESALRRLSTPPPRARNSLWPCRTWGK